MKRVLIITYYWPPSGGSAVLRWLKFTKYLRGYGWEPVIYTPANPEPQEIDESLFADIPENIEILKTRIIEPYNIYKFLTGKKQHERLGVALMNDNKKKGMMNRISLWIRSNLFIPDPRRLWIGPSVNFLSNYLNAHPVNVVITTGPPHSMHLIGLRLKLKQGIKWLADFRDPWTNIDFYKDLSLTRGADRLHKKLEKSVLANADHIITVSPGMTKEYQAMGAQKISTVTNGFDETPALITNKTGKFTIIHLGSLPKSRNPLNLWKALAELINENPGLASELEIILIGKSDVTVLESIAFHHLREFVVQKNYIPHNQTPEILANAAILLLCINNTPNARGILTNKFFEYLSVQRPILTIGPKDGDAAFILKESGAGEVFDYNEIEELKIYLAKSFDLHLQRKLTVNSSGIEKYSRKILTEQLASILNSL